MHKNPINCAEYGETADGPDRNPSHFSAHQGFVLAGLHADPCEYGAPERGAEQSVDRIGNVVKTYDAGGDADEMTDDGNKARCKCTEAAELCGPFFSEFDFFGRNE